MKIDLQSGNILFDLKNTERVNHPQRGAVETQNATDAETGIILSKPFTFTNAQPIRIKISDFGVGE
jgi:hypothetical protein